MIVTDLMKLEENEFHRMASRPQYKNLIQKKLRFLAAASSKGCRITGAYYLINGEEKGSRPEVIREFMQLTREEWFEYRTKESVRLINREQLQNELQNIKEAEAVIVRGFRPAECCGQVWYTADRHIFIEAYKGGYPGVLEALEIPTFYVTDSSGRVDSKQENVFSKYYAFDGTVGAWSFHTCADEKVALEDRQIKEICEMLRMIDPERLGMKVAWGIWQDALSVYDLYLPIGVGILE